jgi:hypothetical protein
MGYDCNPGFARAKCVLTKDMKKFNDKLFEGSYKNKNEPEELISGINNKCNCTL